MKVTVFADLCLLGQQAKIILDEDTIKGARHAIDQMILLGQKSVLHFYTRNAICELFCIQLNDYQWLDLIAKKLLMLSSVQEHPK